MHFYISEFVAVARQGVDPVLDSNIVLVTACVHEMARIVNEDIDKTFNHIDLYLNSYNRMYFVDATPIKSEYNLHDCIQ